MTDQQKLIDEDNIILKSCINMFTIYIGLFCSHKLQQCRIEDECLKLNNFDSHWQFKMSIYSQVIPFLHINNLAINPLLQVVNPPVAKPCGHSMNLINKQSCCEYEHDKSTHQNPSKFEKINVEKACLQIITI